MRTLTIALAGLLALAPAARADDAAAAIREALAKHQASLVRVELTTHVAVEGLPGVAPGTRRTQHVSTGGVVADAEGLVVLSAAALDPAAEAFALLGDVSPAAVGRVTVTAQDGQVREATWLGRDPATGLAFVQVAPAGRTALQPARWAAAETAVGDPLTVASLTAAADGYRPRADLARVAFVGEAVIGLSPAPSGAVGGLVVTSDGAAIGLVSRRGAARAPSGDVLRPDVLAAAREPVLILQPRFAALLKAPPREATLTDLGPPERAWLGVRHRPVTVEVAEARGLDVDSGVLVEALYDGPGKAAGLQPGDVLLELDGIPLDLDPGESFDDLVADFEVGAQVVVAVRRAKKTLRLKVTLAAGPVRPHEAEHQPSPALGALLRAITFYDRVELGLAPEVLGAVVARLEPDGAASRAGLRVGDAIIAVDGKPAAGLADLRHRLEAPGERQATVRRGDQELTLRVRR